MFLGLAMAWLGGPAAATQDHAGDEAGSSERVVLGQDKVPRFVVEATVCTTNFKSSGAVFSTVPYRTVFVYSNGGWEVEARLLHPPASPFGSGSPSTSNCRTVPGGIRHYTIFAGATNARAVASVCPMAFPPPGLLGLFVPWLALGPKSALPTLGPGTMRRFLMVPDCGTDLLNDPRNEGTYRAAYLEPGAYFLSTLSITNNGVGLVFGMEPQRLAPPFAEGHAEMTYEVLASTNVGSAAFPMRAVMKRFGRQPEARSPGDLFVALVAELQVTRLETEAHGATALSPAPQWLFAMDHRPPDLPPERTVNYAVTNDHWEGVSAQRLAELAAIVRATGNARPAPYGGLLTGLLLFVAIGPPMLYYLRRRRGRKGDKE